MNDPWTLLAPLYDWEHEGFVADIQAYLALARRTGGPILELACGTGRIVFPLAQAGYPMTGVDASPGMLAVARERWEAEAADVRARVELRAGDLIDPRLDSRFALAILALDAFGLLTEQSDQLAALGTVLAYLRRGGLLALDVQNGAARVATPDEELRHHFTRPHPAHGRPLTKWVLRQTDRAEQVDHLTYLYDEVGIDGTLRRTVAQHDLRYFTRFELGLLLERAGFVVEAVYGGYDFVPLEADSERLFAVARRRDDAP